VRGCFTSRGRFHAASNLSFVGGVIELSPRLGYESILSELPYLEAADANPVWPAGSCPKFATLRCASPILMIRPCAV